MPGNPPSSSAQSSKRSSTLSPPVKKALTLKEQRALYAAKAKAAGKENTEPAFRTVRVPVTPVTSKPVSRRATKPTYGLKVVMKENLRPSSKFAAKASTEPSPKRGSTTSQPVIKKTLTLKEQRALYATRQKVVTQATRRVPSKTVAEPLAKPSVNRSYSTSPTTSNGPAPASASSVGSPTSPPVVKKALTLKEQLALYAARGKITTPVLREVQSNVEVVAESPTELAIRRYYSTSSTSSNASSSGSPKTDTDEASVSSRTATKGSAGSSSRGSFRTSKPPICPQSSVRKVLAKFEREEEAEAALRRRSPRKKTTSPPVPKTSGQYTLKEQMKFAAVKRAASEKADVEDSTKTSFTEGSSTSGKKRSRDETSSDNCKDGVSGRRTNMESSSRGSKRAKLH